MFNVLLFGINKKIVDKLLERPNARNFNNMEYINLFSVVHVSSYLQLLFTRKFVNIPNFHLSFYLGNFYMSIIWSLQHKLRALYLLSYIYLSMPFATKILSQLHLWYWNLLLPYLFHVYWGNTNSLIIWLQSFPFLE